MDQEYVDEVIGDLQGEVKVKGAETVADNLGFSEEAIRELCPREARKYDKVKKS